MRQKIAQYLLYAALICIAASYLPWFYLQPAYYALRYIVMGCFASALLLTLSPATVLSNRFMQFFACCIGVTAIEFLVFFCGHLRHNTEDLSQLVIAFFSISLGMTLEKETRQWANCCYLFTLALTAMVAANCLYYVGGFYIPEHYVLDEGKNQIGALLGTAAAGTFFFGMKLKEQRVHFWILFALAVEMLLLIRARAAGFALGFCTLFIIVKEAEWNIRWNYKTLISIVALALACFVLVTGFIGDELTTFFQGGKSLESNATDALTSNRWERNLQGLAYFCEHPFSGELAQDSGIKLIHNYFILRMTRYGIWCLPMLVLYAGFAFVVIRGIFRKHHTEASQAGFFVCTIPLMISLLEPSFPYGPGSVQLFAFLLLGYALKNTKQTTSL